MRPAELPQPPQTGPDSFTTTSGGPIASAAIKKGLFDGLAVFCDKSGKTRIVTHFKASVREGPARVLHANGDMLLCAQYKHNKLHGPACLFAHRTPSIVLEYDKGKLQNAYEIVFDGEQASLSQLADGGEAFQATAARVTAIEATLIDRERELKHEWTAEKKSRTAQAKAAFRQQRIEAAQRRAEEARAEAILNKGRDAEEAKRRERKALLDEDEKGDK